MEKNMISRLLLAAVMLVILSWSTTSAGYTGVTGEDETLAPSVIELAETQGRVSAFKAGEQPQEIDLNYGEQIRSVQARGLVGSVVTSERLLAITADPFTWISLPLELGEETAESYVSTDLIIFITMARAVVFDGSLGRFVAYDIALGENIVSQVVQPRLAGFVTHERAVGYAAGSGTFNEKPFSLGEIFRDIEVSVGIVSITTSERVLVFQAPSAQWIEQAPPLDEPAM